MGNSLKGCFTTWGFDIKKREKKEERNWGMYGSLNERKAFKRKKENE